MLRQKLDHRSVKQPAPLHRAALELPPLHCQALPVRPLFVGRYLRAAVATRCRILASCNGWTFRRLLEASFAPTFASHPRVGRLAGFRGTPKQRPGPSGSGQGTAVPVTDLGRKRRQSKVGAVKSGIYHYQKRIFTRLGAMTIITSPTDQLSSVISIGWPGRCCRTCVHWKIGDWAIPARDTEPARLQAPTLITGLYGTRQEFRKDSPPPNVAAGQSSVVSSCLRSSKATGPT